MRVLLMEDDPALGASLVEYLLAKGFIVHWLADDREFNKQDLSEFDVLVLDLILPHARGEDLLKELRKNGSAIPVLILTAKSELADKKVCFEGGADDYLSKPFEPLELVLRLRCLCKREGKNTCLAIGDVQIDLDAQLVFYQGKDIALSAKAWDLLVLLIENQDALVSKEQIFARVWPDVTVGEDVIRHYIGELRKRISAENIVTYKGRGYRLKK